MASQPVASQLGRRKCCPGERRKRRAAPGMSASGLYKTTEKQYLRAVLLHRSFRGKLRTLTLACSCSWAKLRRCPQVGAPAGAGLGPPRRRDGRTDGHTPDVQEDGDAPPRRPRCRVDRPGSAPCRGAPTRAADLRSPQTPPERLGLRRASTLAPSEHLAPHPAHETAIASVPSTVRGPDAVYGRYPEQDLALHLEPTHTQ
jgi:hypothetical protein